MDFKKKYLKYKQKYLDLKKNQMGSGAPVIPPRGDFSFIPDDNEREMLSDAFNAVESVIGGWETFIPEPEAGSGFMFSRVSPESIRAQIDAAIMASPSGNNHSGSSYGWTMRQMQGIARLGWDAYVTLRLNRIAEEPQVNALRHQRAVAIDHTPVFSVRDEKDTTCPICFEILQSSNGDVSVVSDGTKDGTAANPVKCGHKFHKNCINNWIDKNHTTCPLCRSIMASILPSL